MLKKNPKGNHTKRRKIWCWLAEVVCGPSRYTQTQKKILNVLVADIHMGGKKKHQNQGQKLAEGRTCQTELWVLQLPYAESRNTDNEKTQKLLIKARSTSCQEHGFKSHRKARQWTTASSISTTSEQQQPAGSWD